MPLQYALLLVVVAALLLLLTCASPPSGGGGVFAAHPHFVARSRCDSVASSVCRATFTWSEFSENVTAYIGLGNQLSWNNGLQPEIFPAGFNGSLDLVYQCSDAPVLTWELQVSPTAFIMIETHSPLASACTGAVSPLCPHHLDCFGVCTGSALVDRCGTCGGGNAALDVCEVCNGHDHARDYCGICFGRNHTLDSCGVCGGNDRELDACGICGGANSSIDICGVCHGNGSCCQNGAIYQQDHHHHHRGQQRCVCATGWSGRYCQTGLPRASFLWLLIAMALVLGVAATVCTLFSIVYIRTRLGEYIVWRIRGHPDALLGDSEEMVFMGSSGTVAAAHKDDDDDDDDDDLDGRGRRRE